MKVGTDAVLLGAWADVGQANTILDIGTGSGVIALMMAQRTSSHTKIDAIELLKQDAGQALENSLNSPWAGKISVVNARLQDFFPQTKYDLILCNPPFFSNSLLPPSEKRTTVRHDTALTQDQLIESVVNLLSPAGKFSVIFPPTESENFISKASASNLYLHRLTRFFSRPEKPQVRSLLEFGLAAGAVREDCLLLYESEDQWTEEYRALTHDFYLGQ